MDLEINLKSMYIKQDGLKKSQLERDSERIKASERLRIDILKEDNPIRMLDLSLLCISIFTGDTVWYEQNREKIKYLNF